MSAPGDRKILADKAARLRAQGMTGLEIAEQLGVGKSYAYELLTDPTGEKARARKRRYDLVCVDCGGRVNGTTPSKIPDLNDPVCLACAPAHYAVWTREAIVCAIQEWADDHGGIPPRSYDWSTALPTRGHYPSLTQVQFRFGAWNVAIIAAGFEPHPTGPVGGYTALTPAQRREAVRRYVTGESSNAIAAVLGCSPPTVLRWVRRAGVPVRRGWNREAA